MGEFLKITYNSESDRVNDYLKRPSPTYQFLVKEIELCLFKKHELPPRNIRIYWIDEDGDGITIVNQCDYEVFIGKKKTECLHLQVSPADMATKKQTAVETATKTTATSTESATNQAKVPPAAGSYDFAVHSNVECDACLMSPITGFRYKCIQCPNYDLCQNCEAKHLHSEHMMVRMPTNNCPSVVEAYITGRNSRRHGKRSKNSCSFVKNGLSVVIDDEAESSTAAGSDRAEQAAHANGKERHHGRKHHRRHHRNNFFAHLYEMMHDLAEGGGAAAAAHAMGEATTSTSTGTNVPVFDTNENPVAAANEAVNVAVNAAANATDAATAAHMAAKKAHEIAAKVATETDISSVKNITAVAADAGGSDKEKEVTKEKVDASTSPNDPGISSTKVPNLESPVYEHITQFLDPQYMKTGIQILNNFSDIFAKMLDPIENSESGGDNNNTSDLNKTSKSSSSSSLASNLISLESDKKSLTEKSIEKETNPEQAEESKTETEAAVVVNDLGSDSESNCGIDSFIMLDAPVSSTPSAAASAQATPPQSLNKPNVMDFAQLSADLKAHMIEETAKDSAKTATAIKAVAATNINANEPVVTTTTAVTSNSSNTSSDLTKTEEKRAVPVFHANETINRSVLAMMAMGFSNEGAWLTKLLESVNGNIAEALDIMSVAQRDGSR